MEFEWDASKDAYNVRKHGVSFAEAVESFFDPRGLLLVDEKHSGAEDRFAGFTIWYDIDIQVAYNYQGRRPSILGYTEPFSTFEAGLRKDFLNEALTVGLRFSDIFNKQQFNTNIESDTFSQNMYRKRESRFAFITITYNFGAKEVKQKEELLP